MQLKKAVNSILLPAMERNGFALIDRAPAYNKFGNNDDSLRVIVDKNPWPPSELRVSFFYRDHFGRFSHFDLDRLDSYQNLDLFYKSQEEMEEKLKTIADILETHALMFLANMRDNYVFWQKEMNLLFYDDPEKQAVNYAEINSLDMSFELSNFLYLENQVSVMRGENMCNWRQNFEKHSDKIVGLASYYGEIIRRKDQVSWYNGKLMYDQGTGYPNYDVVQYWNYGLYMKTCRLVHRSLR